MSIIKSHDITLYGGNDEYNVVLRPLADKYLPYLYKWNADPEVLYWTEGGTAETNISYTPDTVHKIYGGDMENCLYFLVEVNSIPIGECWLQKMNLLYVKAMYDPAIDVRRIDMSIGEKSYWNKGIGSLFIAMLIDFAFNGENVDVLHCFCEDYNIRSRRVWEKNGFIIVLSEDLPQPQKGKFQYHYRLTRSEYIEHHRYRPSDNSIFTLPIIDLQPSQLYISDGKLRNVKEWLNQSDKSNFDPVPIKEFCGRKLMTDGHTRTVAAYLAGWESIPVYIDTDEFDMDTYVLDVKWCDEAGIHSPIDLVNRIVSHKDYERLWRRRNCDEYYKGENPNE
ncbi:MAG: GNAT family N-acetyltransferase [Oscillospiraceae bacterium]|nr:GNAT family N-acetyltransferase [Oscillospiraceae bacterium]